LFFPIDLEYIYKIYVYVQFILLGLPVLPLTKYKLCLKAT